MVLRMKVLVNIGHPAQVHLFRNALRILMEHGHECRITAVNKEISLNLLDLFGFEYDVVGSAKPTSFGKGVELFRIDANLLRIARSFRPDLLLGGVGNAYVAHVGRLIQKPSIVFDDTEHATIQHRLTDPFVSVICTPSCYMKDLGDKQVRYNGYHQLASLHPNYFTPDPAVLTELGLGVDDNIFLVRFAAFHGSHDSKTEHFDKRYIPDLITKLEDYGTVVISSEVKLHPALQKYQYKLSPDKYHDLLYFSKMYVGEGSTSALEAAVLGVPSLHFERLNIGGQRSTVLPYIGVLNELQMKYNLLYSFCDESALLSKVDEILIDLDRVQRIWRQRREALLRDKIDVTAFIVWFVENYPASSDRLNNNPTIGKNFKSSSSGVL